MHYSLDKLGLSHLFIIVLLPTLLLLESCAIGPFSNSYTARSNGAGNLTVDVGSSDGTSIPYVRVGNGFSKNLDIGVVAERSFGQIIGGLWAKFAIINANLNGGALAADVGYGMGDGARFMYAGPIASYKFTWLEPYVSVRLNHRKINDKVIKTGTSEGNIHIAASKVNSLRYTVGNTFWPLEWLGINVNFAYVQDLKKHERDTSHNILINGGIMLRP